MNFRQGTSGSCCFKDTGDFKTTCTCSSQLYLLVSLHLPFEKLPCHLDDRKKGEGKKREKKRRITPFNKMAFTPFPVVALGLGICFLSTTAHAAYMFNGNGFRQVDVAKLLANIKPLRTPVGRAVSRFRCARGDAIIAVGKEWTERCRQCRCTEAGTVCTSQYTCPQPYNSMQEITCAKWSENQCCCEAEGCVLANGTLVAVNEDMPFDPERPCESCTCTGANRTSCRIKDFVHGCGMKCVDGVRVKGQCCPHCPNGRTCFMPDKETRRLSKAELPSLRIVRESSPVVLRTGTPTQVICTCEAGKMVADCRPMSPGLGIRIKQLPLVV